MAGKDALQQVAEEDYLEFFPPGGMRREDGDTCMGLSGHRQRLAEQRRGDHFNGFLAVIAAEQGIEMVQIGNTRAVCVNAASSAR